jgi:hypothetical protein
MIKEIIKIAIMMAPEKSKKEGRQTMTAETKIL